MTPAWQAFSKGQSVFLIGGSWYAPDLRAAMGDKVHFMAPPRAPAARVSHRRHRAAVRHHQPRRRNPTPRGLPDFITNTDAR